MVTDGDTGMSFSEAEGHADERTLSGASRIFLSVFIVLVIAAANLIALSHVDRRVRPFAKTIASCSGLEQAWSLFAPRARRINGHLTAVISFADGSMRLYEMPRFDRYNAWRKFRRVKMRKFFNDNMSNPVGRKYMPSVLSFLAASVDNRSNSAEQISLVFNHAVVSEVEGTRLERIDQLSGHTLKDPIFVFQIRRGVRQGI